MEWLVTTGLIIALVAALPYAIIAARNSVRRNSRMAGVALSIGLAFAMMFEPRRQETMDHIAKRNAMEDDHDLETEKVP